MARKQVEVKKGKEEQMMAQLKTSLQTLHSLKVAEIKSTLKEEKRKERAWSKKHSEDASRRTKAPTLKPSSRIQSAGNKPKPKQVRFNEDLDV